MKNTLIIGGGPSGMMAAIASSMQGKKVTLIEKNEKLGKKLFITGKGRCNVTNASDVDTLIENIPGNGNFLYSAFYTFSSSDLMDFIENLGVKLKIERGNRVFPLSDKSSDVIKALERKLQELKVDILFNTTVKDIVIENGTVKGIVDVNDKFFPCDSLVIATGGKSYPLTGSTGDGHKFAQKAGHKITPLKPSLVPLVIGEQWIKELQGLSLKNVSIKVVHSGKTIYDNFGEMLFTHFGVSGPIILSSSRFVGSIPGESRLLIDLKPALNLEQLDKRIQGDFEKYSRKMFKNALDDLLPQKLIPIIIKLSMIDGDKEVNQINREERIRLVRLLKELPLTITGTRSFNEAIITSGGISVKEIDPSSMESKLVKGLYFAGEVMDLDGLTGGFNLQIAFSTGYCAGINC